MKAVALEQAVFVQLQGLAGQLMRETELLLRPFGLTPSQYNVLRILRGAGAEGLSCHEIADRMITRDPDMTRLLDRLEKQNLVTRERLKTDRRVVRTRVTEIAVGLLSRLDRPLAQLHATQLAQMGEENLKTLSLLLTAAKQAQEVRAREDDASSSSSGKK